MLQKEIVSPVFNLEALLPEQRDRFWEIRNRFTWLLLKGELDWKNLEGRVIDLGTGSGAGLVALEALGATQAIGVEDGSRLRKSLGKISQIPVNPFEAFPPADALRPQIFEMSNERYLEIVKKEGWEISLITCFWIGYEPPARQIEEVLIPSGQVIITATEGYYSYLKEIHRKTNLETQIIEIPEYLVDLPVNDKFILIGTKRN